MRVRLFAMALSGSTACAALAQPLEWVQLPVSGPSPRVGHAMAYDSARQVTVLFGGETESGNSGETWEWNGSAWALRSSTGPSPRWGHAMAYDTVRHVTVLFGDTGGNDQTWEWDGNQWTLRPVPGPGPRVAPGMSHDTSRGVCVLFGGGQTSTPGTPGLSDTWEWNGAQWVQRLVAGPSARYGHAMAFDSHRGVSVIFGGAPNNSGLFNNAETWEWNGAEWLQRAASGPSTRAFAAMTFNTESAQTILFGGANYALLPNPPDFSDTWAWNGSVWTQLQVSGPPARDGGVIAFHAANNTVVMFGGYGYSAVGGYLGDTWVLRRRVCPGCPTRADVASLGGLAGCDGQMTVDDIVYYLGEFFAADVFVADITGLGGSGPPDGSITVDDLVAYLAAFFAGCP